MNTIGLDEAIRLLEVGHIEKLSVDDIPSIERKAQFRWHPDKIMGSNPDQIERYTRNFQNIEESIEILRSYLSGEYQAGEKSKIKKEVEYPEPEEIIRQNAMEMQPRLTEL
ncbi:MAG: hypothetical protein IIA45_11670 [Bacteroidetes bacterium]|nr:hypothetical protein [Bacteroidota bacterium]